MGTYDLRRSGLGYLFATQDARATETYWRLTEVMGQLETNLYCCSSNMIKDVVSEEIDIAYNVLGSYANNHLLSDKYAVIYPSDITNVMSRSMILPTTSDNERSAKLFIDHVLETVFVTSTRRTMYNLNLSIYEGNTIKPDQTWTRFNGVFRPIQKAKILSRMVKCYITNRKTINVIMLILYL